MFKPTQRHVPETQYVIEETQDPHHQSEISPDRPIRESQIINEPTMQTQHVVRNDNAFYADLGQHDFYDYDELPSMDEEPSKNGGIFLLLFFCFFSLNVWLSYKPLLWTLTSA